MDLETLFTDVKWEILKELSKKGQSPIELSKKLNTTISNISQQLKLLEMAGLVKKEKISNRDKGKPRAVFSIMQDRGYMILLMNAFAEKKLITLTEHHKTILKIWLFENYELQYYLEKFYWQVEEDIPDIKAIAINPTNNNLMIVAKNPNNIKQKPGLVVIRKRDGPEKTFNCSVFTEEQAQKKPALLTGAYPIYDPNRMIGMFNTRT